MGDYTTLDANSVRTPSGSILVLLGRVGLRYSDDDGVIDVDSEMLAPPMAIAVYPGSIRFPMRPRGEVLSEIIGALQHPGFTVELVGPVP